MNHKQAERERYFVCIPSTLLRGSPGSSVSGTFMGSFSWKFFLCRHDTFITSIFTKKKNLVKPVCFALDL